MINEVIEKLPPEMKKYKSFRVADDKKITVDVDTGKYQTGSKATQPLYTLEDLSGIKLPKSAKHIQFVPGGTPYTILDFDTDKSLSKQDREKQVTHIEKKILNTFEGLIELSTSELGVHAYVKDERLKSLPSDPYKISLDTEVGKIDVEIFTGDAPIVLTGTYFTDNSFNFDTTPRTVRKAIADKLSTVDIKTSSVSKLDPIKLDHEIDNTRMSKVIAAADKIGTIERSKVGYLDEEDCSNADYAYASILLKASDMDPAMAHNILLDWMIHHRPLSHAPKTVKEIANKAKRAIESAHTSLVKLGVTKKNITSLDKFVNKFSIGKKERDKMMKEEVNLYEGLMFKGQITIWIARPGGGKTAMAKDLAMKLGSKYKVMYILEDADQKGYSDMSDVGDAYGFKVLSSFANIGTTPGDIIKSIVSLAAAGEDVSDIVFIFDTMKKFMDVLGKASAKELFMNLRELTMKGASVLMLGHAKKYLDENGKLIYDGVSDIVADVDSMFYIYDDGNKKTNNDRYVTFEYEKGRAMGATRELSFRVQLSDYTAHKQDELVDVRTHQLKNEHTEEVDLVKSILSCGDETQTKLVKILNEDSALSRTECKRLLVKLDGMEWHTFRGGKNAKIYTLQTPVEAVQEQEKDLKKAAEGTKYL